jgi:uncharacterized protein
MPDTLPFWKFKSLAEMTPVEWESLCDGCARCCLMKLEDEDTSEIWYTDVACALLDSGACRCGDYKNRSKIMADCVTLTPDEIGRLNWLPPTCGYRLINEGKDLYWWHPLVSGDPDTVHAAGISARGRTVREQDVREEDLEDHIVDWPMEAP